MVVKIIFAFFLLRTISVDIIDMSMLDILCIINISALNATLLAHRGLLATQQLKVNNWISVANEKPRNEKEEKLKL